ncbi:MAG: hypothetical protein EOO03_12100 [Chitinophagaceae bacterium]|nr:MAG: hypothetical protein EOO03_12100 [Chitinophagaceae bacterium]
MLRCFLFLVVLSACGCKQKKEAGANLVNEKIEVLKADQAFSDMCEAEGMKAAYMEYIDSNGVLIRPDHLPIVGADAIDFLLRQEDAGYTLKWQPQNAYVASAADLAYTYGVYALQPRQADTILYGTYVNIWKKQADGHWKFVLDAGNEGIGADSTSF